MSDTIAFRYYPTSNRVPGTFAEIDASGANTGTINQKTLIIAQKLPIGTAPVGVPYLFSSLTDWQLAMGLGSQMSIMGNRYRKLDGFGEVWGLPLADDPASVAAVGTFTFTGPATGPGQICAYVAGTQAFAAVAVGDTATIMAANVAAAIAVQPDLPVIATAAAGVLTITAKNKGLAGNDIGLSINWIGAPYEATPPGVTVVIAPMAGGAGNPASGMAAALANLTAATGYDFVALAYNDPTSLNDMASYFSDAAGTWSWAIEEFGGAFAGFNGTLAGAVTLGGTRNDDHMCVLPVQNTPSPSWYIAADLCAVAAVSLRANPAVPLRGLQLNIMAPKIADRFDISERNSLLYDGMSTFTVDQGGNVLTDRLCTTYQTDPAGAPDNAWLDVETPYTLMAIVRAIRSYIESFYQNKILVSDGTRIPPGSAMTTSQIVLASAVAMYYQLATQGLCQNPDVFAKQAVGENAGNGLVKLMLPVQVANQLRIVAMLVAFTKP